MHKWEFVQELDYNDIHHHWRYFLSLERDLERISHYIEVCEDNINVYSFELSKLILLSTSEVETCFKLLSKCISGENKGNIGEYKEVILTKFPRIVEAEVHVITRELTLRPFDGWDSGTLWWWDSYGELKHNRNKNFNLATLKTVLYTLGGLLILLLYIRRPPTGELCETFPSETKVLLSKYLMRIGINRPDWDLPDFCS